MTTHPTRSMSCAWQPESFVLSVPDMEKSEFVAQYREAFLLVHLTAADVDLSVGLAATSKLGHAAPVAGYRGPGDELGFQTVSHGQATVRRMLSEIDARPTHNRPLELERSQLSEARYLVPICKSGASTVFMERVTVGRSRNNDIVLRHKTVSKFHAWWEYDKRGALFLRDADSKNFTMLNGSVLKPERVRVEMGASVRFGSVNATVCSSETVWELLSGR